MLGPLGQALVMASLLFAAMGSAVAFRAGQTGSLRLWHHARRLALGFAAATILANIVMIVALLQRDFSISYVAEVGSWATPTYYTVASLWASLNGSILLWAGVLGFYTGALVLVHGDDHREYMPWTVSVLLGLSVFFVWLVAGIANPFAPTAGVIPTDGPGPNPLLQNHPLMAFHPPALYLGYVGMSVPFSMACAALFAGRLDAGWVAPLRRWTLLPWTSLTIGIVMGGWWSYEVLGWGGYWAWDPVENASFHPWLTATAFLHSAMLLERRGLARNWSIVLIMSTFLLTLVGTFMTRSGVFNSVHSFTQSSIGPVFLGFIAISSVFCLLLLAFRVHLLEGDDADEAPMATGAIGAIMGWLVGRGRVDALSREFALIVQNLVFAAFTFVVLLGTLYPLITEAIDENWRVSVGEPYFDQLTLPLGVLLVFLMGVGPSLPWGRAKTSARLVLPLVGGFVFAAVFAVLGFTKPGTILALLVCGFALVANIREYVEPVLTRMRAKGENPATAAVTVFSRAHRRFGGHIAHLGVVMAVVAIALSKGYKTQKDFVFKPGEPVAFQGYDVTYAGAKTIEEPHRDSLIASFTVQRDGADLVTATPRMNTYIWAIKDRNGQVVERRPRMREPIGTPYVHSTLTGDLYFSLMQVQPDGSWATARLMVMPAVPWLWVATGIIAFGSIICVIPPRRRRQQDKAGAKPVLEAAAK